MIAGIILDDFYGPFQPKPLKVKKKLLNITWIKSANFYRKRYLQSINR